MTIKICIVDDQALVREGLISLFRFADGFAVIAQAKDGNDLIHQLTEGLTPDIILLDMRMPKMNGVETLTALKQLNIPIPALILTTFDDHDLIMQGMQAGARGYLLKDISLEQLTSAIEQVLAGELAIQPALTERLIQNFAKPNHSESQVLSEPLSSKEIEVLKLLASGFSNKEIASTLHKAEGTIRNQVSEILAKLCVRDRTRAVLKAIELGLLH